MNIAVAAVWFAKWHKPLRDLCRKLQYWRATSALLGAVVALLLVVMALAS